MPSLGHTAERSLNDIMAEAVEAREAGDTQRVVKLLQEAYAVQPAPQILNNLGKVYEQLGAYRQAYAAYQKVANDPAAPQDLRALDTARLNGLRPKLNDAWLKPEVKPPNATVRVDGDEVDLDVDGEAKLRKGRHAVQFTGADGATAALRFVDTPVGQRTTVAEDLTAPNPLGGALSLEGAGEGISSLTVNDSRVGGDLGALRSLHVEPGTYTVRLERGGGIWTAQVSPGPGETITLKDHLVAARSASTTTSDGEANTTVHAQAAPTGGLPMGAVITTGAGVVAAIAGGALLSMGNSERDGLSQAAQAAPNQQAARQVLIDGNNKADSLESMGAAALGVGAAAAAGGLVWWVMSPADDDASALNESTPRLQLTAWGRGLLISGSF